MLGVPGRSGRGRLPLLRMCRPGCAPDPVRRPDLPPASLCPVGKVLPGVVLGRKSLIVVIEAGAAGEPPPLLRLRPLSGTDAERVQSFNSGQEPNPHRGRGHRLSESRGRYRKDSIGNFPKSLNVLPNPALKPEVTDCAFLEGNLEESIVCCSRRFFPLARRITRDDSLAEDALQTSWIKILQSINPVYFNSPKACPRSRLDSPLVKSVGALRIPIVRGLDLMAHIMVAPALVNPPSAARRARSLERSGTPMPTPSPSGDRPAQAL